jgi:ComF family protein
VGVVSVAPQIASFKRVALDLLFPPYCIGCGKEGNYFCGHCINELAFISPPICRLCGRPLMPDARCPGCIGESSPIDGIRAPFLFDGLVRHAIHELKYNNLRAVVPMLAAYLHEYLVENPLPSNVLVPVPIHPKRLRERGYNQSALLTRELHLLSGHPLVEDSLVRTRYITPQAKAASAAERLKNISGAFACKDTRLKGKEVILVDDVSTSGATMNACAAALKSAGALSVWGLALALEL